ncbi:unnamed protein product [Protopolystoma xenopodis]|uniref:Ubiquitin-like domain-containing protein n=1 Tax=Protopolystoma xenopodis TaxID=117903 RepID=A0A3S5C128_9PLAT|nr:unnamed protein product [Protopolystoma xenopodis]
MLNQQKNVRLIFQGRELTDRDQRRSSLTRGPLRRLCDYSVTDNATIHCLVTNRPSSSIVSASTDDSTQIRRRRNPGGSFYSYIQSSTVSAAATFFDRSNSTQLNDSGNSGARQPVSGTPNRFISTANALLEHIFSDLDLSNRMLLICFTGILCISWLFHLTHRHYYNHYSTITLLGVTASFVLGFFLQLPPGEIAFTAQVIPRLHIRQSREPSAPEAPLSSSQSIAHTLSERVPSSSSHQVLETATIQAAESGLQNTIFSAEPSQATSSISQPLAEAPVEDLVSSVRALL